MSKSDIQFRKSAVFGLSVVMFLSLTQLDVLANQRCSTYASTAVSHYNEAKNLNCGFFGNRWTNDYQGHYSWCLKVRQSVADKESQARKDALQQCRGRGGGSGYNPYGR